MGYDFYTQVWLGMDNQAICDMMTTKNTGFDIFSDKHEQTGKFIWDECAHGMDYYAKSKAYNYKVVSQKENKELIVGNLFVSDHYHPLRLILVPWSLHLDDAVDIKLPRLAPIYGVGDILSCGWGILVCEDLKRTKRDHQDIYDEAESYKDLYKRIANEKFDSVEAKMMISSMKVHTDTVER